MANTITCIAFLRAVNVGGTGKLSMAVLREMATEIGFQNPRTHIASGNLIFETDRSIDDAGAALEARLQSYAGKPVGVIMRTPADLDELIESAPFGDVPGNKLIVLLLDTEADAQTAADVKNQTTELIRPGPKCLYIHYPDGQGRSRLTLAAAVNGTARNMNTLKKVRDMC